jgi:hypothetical protein
MTVALVAAVAVAGASACQVKAGAAGFVGDTRITDSQVSSYIQPNAAPYVDPSSGQTIYQRTYVMETLLTVHSLSDAFAAIGKPISEKDLESEIDKLLAAGGATRDTVTANLGKAGIEPAFTDVYLQEVALVQNYKAADAATVAQLNSALGKIPVTVSPRYGTFDVTTGVLNTAGGLPSFLTVTTPSATPTATSG